MNILLLEDDEGFGSSIEDFLSECGYQVTWVKDGQTAYEIIYENSFDLFLFDINVPHINGLKLLAEIRSSSNQTPTIFLTSFKDIQTVKTAFCSGCDDYLKKPFDLDELILRIEALMKRTGFLKNNIDFKNGYTFDLQNKRVFFEGNDANITSKAIELLILLLRQKNKIVSKDEIINSVWGFEEEFSEGSLRVYINRLKKIVGNESIINIKGLGYKLLIHE